MNRLELEQRMMELDSITLDLYPSMSFECVIVGGSALLIRNIITRGTLDVDVLEVSKEVEELFTSFNFNTRVKAVLDCFSYHYADRLELVDIETKSIQYYTPSIEDLIVSKLYAYRAKDIEDLEKIKKSKKYDQITLDKIVKEARLSAITERRYLEMVELYNGFFKE